MPDKNMFGETVLAPNELLTHVILPAPGAVKSATYEIRFKQSHDWPMASASVALTIAGQTIRGARVIMGAVAPIPWRSSAAENALSGKPLSQETATAAAEAAVQGAKPMSNNAYKVQLTRTAVKRAVMKAGGLKTV
jgi:xanthine dehydrogenase YagS FAD-binding subunit